MVNSVPIRQRLTELPNAQSRSAAGSALSAGKVPKRRLVFVEDAAYHICARALEVSHGDIQLVQAGVVAASKYKGRSRLGYNQLRVGGVGCRRSVD